MSESKNRRSVLIVDDEADIRAGLVKSFAKQEFQVFEAESGNQGIEILKNNTVSLILSDFRMNNGTGEDLLFFVRKTKKLQTPFVFMTGFSDTEEDELIQMGAQIVISKPFSRQDLVQKCLGLISG